MSASEASLRQTRPRANWTVEEDLIVINGYETGTNPTPIRELRAQIPNHSTAEIQIHYQNLMNATLTKGQIQALGQLWIRLVILLQFLPICGGC